MYINIHHAVLSLVLGAMSTRKCMLHEAQWRSNAPSARVLGAKEGSWQHPVRQ